MERWNILSYFLVGVILFLIVKLATAPPPEKEVAYSEFKQLLKDSKVKEVKISKNKISFLTTDNRRLKSIPLNDPGLIEELNEKNILYYGTPSSELFDTIIGNVLWIAIFIFLWWLLFLRPINTGGKQAFQFGRSRAKLQHSKNIKVGFSDVAGIDEVKEELKEIVEFLKNPKKFQRLGGRVPKGVLLYGAPGTGKTLLAKAVAGEAGVPFFSTSGSEFVELFVGVGASRIRDLFEKGRRNAPCVLFIDELDAVGRYRGAGLGSGHDEREQTLNQLLVEMDGFDTTEGVIIIAATNRPDILDPALLRPGRFDRRIYVPVPDIKGRLEILKVHAKKIKLSKDVDLSIIAKQTPGFVGSDLENIINEAALLAARRNKNEVTMEELEEATERVVTGPLRKSRIINANEKKVVAYHESGHALIAKLLPDAEPLHKISIVPRGPALGYTLQLPSEDRYLIKKDELLTKIKVLLGGRAAEKVVFGEITTGAKDDLEKATELARKMVCEYGMSEKLGPVTYRKDENPFLGKEFSKTPLYSNLTGEMIDSEIKNILSEAEKNVIEMLKNNMEKLNKLATALIENETLEKDFIEKLLAE